MASAQDKERLDTIRARLGEASTDWRFIDSARYGEQIAARLAPNLSPVAIFTLTDECGYQDRDFHLHAHSDMRFVLDLLRQAFAEIRRLREPAQLDEAKNFAAECAMKCDDAAFRSFLHEAHGIDTSDRERIAVQVRNLLQVSSRSKLNSDPKAAERWKSLRASFEAWRMVA